MDHPLPESLAALTDPSTLWTVLQSLPLRISVIRPDSDGGFRLVATDLTARSGGDAPAVRPGADLGRAFAPRALRRLEEARDSGAPVRYTTPLELPDGSVRVLDGVNLPLPDGQILVLTYDLTERVAAVERAQEYTSAILRASRDRFWVTGRDLVIRHYEGPHDWRTPAGSVGRTMADVYPEELVERFRAHIAETLETGEMHTVLAEAVLEPGRAYETRIVPFGPDEVLLAARDVTEYHRGQKLADLRSALEDVSSRTLRGMFELVGPALHQAGDALLGDLGDLLSADVVTLGRRVDADSFERLFVWARPEYVGPLAEIPRVIDSSLLPDWFSLVTEGDAIIVESVDAATLGLMARRMLDRIQARSVAVVPFQGADELTAYLSFYWFRSSMPEVQGVLGSIRSIGVNLIAAARRGEAEAARVEATDRLERALAALQVNEERFRLVSRATNDVLWDWDLVSDELWWGDGITTVLGYPRNELGPTIDSWERLIHPDDVDRVIGSIRAAANSGIRWTSEYRVAHRRGTYLWVLDRGEVLHDAEGRPVRMVGGLRDVTERRRTDTLLQRQARLLEAATDVIYERDLDGRIIYWNQAAERTYGWTADEVQGRSVVELFHGDAASYAAAMVELLRDGEWAGEFLHRRADGSDVQVEARWSLLRDVDGSPSSVLAINTDVTERRRLEQQLLRAQRMESIGTLAGGMAHDLNNVLTPILMTTEMLRAKEADPDREAALATIEMAAQRGADLVRLVLSYSRGVEARDEDVAVDALLTELATFIAETFPRNITVKVATPEERLHVLGDRTQLAQVLLNLCVNARDAMPGGGELVVAARRDPGLGPVDAPAVDGPGTVVITVSDTGPGIDPAIADRIYEPFFTTKAPGAGTGLGLATASAIAQSHRGVLEFRNEAAGGATFVLTLPLAPRPVEPPVRAEERETARGRGELVLVVDDEEALLSTVGQVLRTHGYRVATVTNGADAVEALRAADPPVDVVITDLMMPGIDGIETARTLRAVRPDIPVVVTSGVKTDDAVARATGEGIHQFLAKPYTIAALLAAVEAALAGRPPVDQ